MFNTFKDYILKEIKKSNTGLKDLRPKEVIIQKPQEVLSVTIMEQLAKEHYVRAIMTELSFQVLKEIRAENLKTEEEVTRFIVEYLSNVEVKIRDL